MSSSNFLPENDYKLKQFAIARSRSNDIEIGTTGEHNDDYTTITMSATLLPIHSALVGKVRNE